MKITVIVKPGSKKGPLVEEADGQLTIFVRERAVDGKANMAVIKLLADYYNVPKSRVEIVGGHTSKHKVVFVQQ